MSKFYFQSVTDLQLFDFGGSIILGVDFDPDDPGSFLFSDLGLGLAFPLDLLPDVAEGGLHELANAVHLAGGDHEVFRLPENNKCQWDLIIRARWCD